MSTSSWDSDYYSCSESAQQLRRAAGRVLPGIRAHNDVCDFEEMLMAMMRMDPSSAEDPGEEWAKEMLKSCLDQATKFVNAASEPSAQEQTKGLSKQLRHYLECYCQAKNEFDRSLHLTNALNMILDYFMHADSPVMDLLSPLKQPTLYTIDEVAANITERYTTPNVVNVLSNAPEVPHGPTCLNCGWRKIVKAEAERQKLEWIKKNDMCKEEPLPMNQSLLNNGEEQQQQDVQSQIWPGIFHSIELQMIKRRPLQGQLKETYESSLLQQEDQLDPLCIPRPSKILFQPTNTSSQSCSATTSNISSRPSELVSSQIPLDTPTTSLSQSGSKLSRFESDHSNPCRSQHGIKRSHDSHKGSQVSSAKRPRLDSDGRVGPQPTPAAQATICAVLRLSSAPWFTQTFPLIFQDENLHLWWLDRQSVIRCKGINFLKNLPHFVVMVALLQRMRGDMDSSFRLELVNTETEICEYQVTIEGHSYRFNINSSPLLSTPFGRNTTVIPVTDVESGQEHIMKMYWGEESRTCEADNLRHIKKLAEEKRELDILEHLPNLICSRDFTLSSTSAIRRRLGLPTKDSRRLHCLVFDKLEPITQLSGMEFWKAFWDTIYCHYRLWNWGIQHRDISDNNLMHRGGKGVLNDFDLARIVCDGVGPAQEFEKAGTMPFIALDLLKEENAQKGVEWLYRHDLESFMWVLLWICVCYEDGEENVPTGRFSRWLQYDPEGCRLSKFAMDIEEIQPTSSYRCIRVPALLMWNFWHKLWREQAEVREQIFLNRCEGLPPPEGWIEPTNGDLVRKMISSIESGLSQNSDPALVNTLRSIVDRLSPDGGGPRSESVP